MSDSEYNPFKGGLGNKNPASDFESGELSQPLQLRRGSTAKERKEILDKYNKQLNESVDETNYNQPKPGIPHKGESTDLLIAKGGIPEENNNSMVRLQNELQGSKKKKYLIYGGVGTVVVGLIILIIVLASGGKKKPDPKPPTPPTPVDRLRIFNPYVLQESTPDVQSFSMKTYLLSLNTSMAKIGNYSLPFFNGNYKDSPILEKAEIRTAVVNNPDTLRFEILDLDIKSRYSVPDEFMGPNNAKFESDRSLNFEEMTHRFKADLNPAQYKKKANSSAFVFRAYQPNADNLMQEFLTTEDQDLFLMKRYHHMGFDVHSTRIMGWSDQASDKLFLDPGNYTINPQKGDYMAEDGKSGGRFQGPGAHPFLMIRISGTNRYAGLFFLCSSPMQLEIKPSHRGSDWTTMIYKSLGNGNLEFYLFFGPDFNDVIKQYQEVIGRPKMMPLWAHGFMSRSPAYKNTDFALETIEKYKEMGLPLQSMIFPLDFYNAHFTPDASLVTAIRQKYPNSEDLSLVLPFSPIVPNGNMDIEWIKVFDKLDVAVEDEKGKRVEVFIDSDANNEKGVTGWCMDPFNPNLRVDFIYPLLLANIRDYFLGLYLENNLPTFTNVVSKTSAPLDIPVRFGHLEGGVGSNKTLPERSPHQYDGSSTFDHMTMHSLFGNKLTMQIIEATNLKSENNTTPFVLTDSSFAGLGQTGAAQLLPPQNPRYVDLQHSLNKMINYAGLFGMPNVGPSLCNYESIAAKKDEDLCARYFQLTVISPLAVYIDRQVTLDNHPWAFQDGISKQKIVTYMQERAKMTTYMRSQLQLAQNYSGSLLRPVFAEFPSWSLAEHPSNVMFGEDVMVLFNFEPDSWERQINNFPLENDWVDLTTFQSYKGGISGPYTFDTTNRTAMFQKSGTVVPIQNISSISEVTRKNISLSIALKNNKASGYLYLEESADKNFMTNAYTVDVIDQMISFKVETLNQIIPTDNDNFIDEIIVSLIPYDLEINTACALKRDMKTIQTLYTSGWKDRQIRISPKNPETNEITPLSIDDVAHIFYMHSLNGAQCDQFAFAQFISQNVTVDDFTYSAIIKPFIADFTGGDIKYQQLTLQLTADNSIVVEMHDVENKIFSEEELTNMRKPSPLRLKEGTLKLWDVLDIQEDPKQRFCFTINLPQDGDQSTYPIFSTCNQFSLQYRSVGIYSFELQSSKSVFGLGERYGDFFLQPNTTYVMYNNDNRLPDSYISETRFMSFGRNGYYPVIYSHVDHPTKNLLTGMIIGDPQNMKGMEGKEITYTRPMEGVDRFTIESIRHAVYFRLIFGETPLKTVETAYEHTQLMKTEAPRLPPPSWTFGYHIPVIQDLEELRETIATIRSKDFNLPLEGFVQDQYDLDNELGMSFNKEYAAAHKFIAQNNYSLIALNNPGYPLSGRYPQDKTPAMIQDKNLAITTLDNKTAYLDATRIGRVFYLNNLLPEITNIFRDMFDRFVKDIGINATKVAVNSVRNEISRVFCMESDELCPNVQPTKNTPQPRTPGPLAVSQGTLPQVSRNGIIEEDYHNLEAVHEARRWGDAARLPLLISQSGSLGIGSYGWVARIYDQFSLSDVDIHYAAQQMESASSLFGLPMTSARFIDFGYDLNEPLILRTVLLNAFSTTMGVVDFYDSLRFEGDALDIMKISQVMRFKYVMLAYTRTQVFKHINFGTPVIRPIFFEAVEPDYSSVGTQFMFGPSILGQTDFTYSDKLFAPSVSWCSVHGGLSESQICFEGNIMGVDDYDYQQMIFLREGSITPLYSFNRTAFNDSQSTDPATWFSGSEDLKLLNLDLHIFNDAYGNGTSRGELLMDGGKGLYGNHDYCYIEFIFNHTEDPGVIKFIDRSNELGGGGNAFGSCTKMEGYQLSRIYIYAYKNLTDGMGNPFISGMINNEIQLDEIEVDPNEETAVFKVSDSLGGSISYALIKNITFSTSIPPAQTVILA